jgi:DNA ligase (NAD+)
VVISQATLHHHGRFEELALTKGSTVSIARRGGVIPHVEGVVTYGTGEDLLAPLRCPVCYSLAAKHADFLVCTRALRADPLPRCRGARIAALAFWLSSLGADGWGAATIRELYEGTDAERDPDASPLLWLYGLQVSDVTLVPGYGTTQATKLLAERDRVSQGVELAKLIRALGVEGIGGTLAERLAVACGQRLDKFLTLDAETLAAIEGVGAKSATVVLQAIPRWSSELIDLVDVLGYLVMERPRPRPAAATGPWSGRVYVFTGEMEGIPRPRAEQEVRDRGGSVAASVTRKTTHVVIAGKSAAGGSTKQRAAMKLAAAGARITILDDDTFVDSLLEV